MPETAQKTTNRSLQRICRDYLVKLRPVAQKFGLEDFVDNTISLNEQGKCAGTDEEVAMLSRACDDERLTRTDVSKLLGKSYRKSYEDGDFEQIDKLRHVGIYSKISTLLYKAEIKNEGRN